MVFYEKILTILIDPGTKKRRGIFYYVIFYKYLISKLFIPYPDRRRIYFRLFFLWVNPPADHAHQVSCQARCSLYGHKVLISWDVPHVANPICQRCRAWFDKLYAVLLRSVRWLIRQQWLRSKFKTSDQIVKAAYPLQNHANHWVKNFPYRVFFLAP